MKLLADISIAPLPSPIGYDDRLLLMGSCFTRQVGELLADHKFRVLHNPTGILFDPLSICRHLQDAMELRHYRTEDLFAHQELFHSWQHHSDFSGTDAAAVAAHINAAVQTLHDFLAKANVLVLTLGSSFSYRLAADEQPVANCHKVPAQQFRKHLLGIDETVAALENTLTALQRFNPGLQVLFTISPVRHLRDGVLENNRSKARLIEAVFRLTNAFPHANYFPAYELIIDVLRDYRWYDIDLAHPNYAATSYVFERFRDSCIAAGSRALMDDVRQIVIARKHRPQFPGTAAHHHFLQVHLEKTLALQKRLPALDWSEEIAYFSGT